MGNAIALRAFQPSQSLNDLSAAWETIVAVLGEEQRAVRGDVEYAVVALDELGLHAQRLLDLGRQTDSPGQVVSAYAVSDCDLHGDAGLIGLAKKRRAGGGDLLDVAVVGSATAAHDVQLPQSFLELSVLRTQLGRIADVELGRLVQFGVAFAGGVRPQPAQPARPRLARVEHVLEVRGMGAVDHVVGRVGRRGCVYLLERRTQALPGRKPPIGFHGERYR